MPTNAPTRPAAPKLSIKKATGLSAFAVFLSGVLHSLSVFWPISSEVQEAIIGIVTQTEVFVLPLVTYILMHKSFQDILDRFFTPGPSITPDEPTAA
jgi:hypothetical protein